MDIMEREHGFRATARQYKERFKAWGLKKNLTGDTAKQMHLDAYRGAVVKVPVERATSSRAVLNALSPSLYRPKSPDLDLDTEKCIHASLSYTHGHFESGDWSLPEGFYLWIKDGAFCWCLELGLVQKFCDLRRGSSDGFELLGRSFDRYKSLLADGSPSLLTATYVSILSFHVNGVPELAAFLLEYVAGLSLIQLGPAHPFTRVWSILLSMDPSQRYEVGNKILEAHLDVFRERINPESHYFTTLPINTTLQLASYDGEPIREAACALRAFRKNKHRSLAVNTEYPMKGSIIQAAMLSDEGRYLEAIAQLDSYRVDLVSGFSRNPIYIYLRGRILSRLGRRDEGISLMSEALSMFFSPYSNLLAQLVILVHLRSEELGRRW
ncbi:hypothetical protein TruAng_007328 [Truncatella angustata]|nr:hypothetical protein TruAng_007328 [Truncatella angustata]